MAEPPDSYSAFLAELKQRIRSARLQAALSVNRELVLLYWSIGRDILNSPAKQPKGINIRSKQEQEFWQAGVMPPGAAPHLVSGEETGEPAEAPSRSSAPSAASKVPSVSSQMTARKLPLDVTDCGCAV